MGSQRVYKSILKLFPNGLCKHDTAENSFLGNRYSKLLRVERGHVSFICEQKLRPALRISHAKDNAIDNL